MCPWLFIALTAASQLPNARPEFEVASIRLNLERGQRAYFGEKSPGALVGEHIPLRVMIQEAWGDSDDSWLLQSMTKRERAPWLGPRIIGGPSWLDNDRFDLTAKARVDRTQPSALPSMRQRQKEMNLMLQSLLEQRFHLRAHRETRQLPIYELTIARPGLLRKAPFGPAACGTSRIGRDGLDWTLDGTAITAFELAGTLSMLLDSRTVVDKTGFTGGFDTHLQWTPDPGERVDSDLPASDQSSGSIFTVLQERLGLRLKKATGPVEVLVIDHLEKLSGN